jgi:hypothetical protein
LFEDGLTTRNPGSGMYLDEPDLSPSAKFSLATIMLVFIVLSVFVKFACIQRWKQCNRVPIAWWDIYENVMWIVFVFGLGVSSVALGRWLMLLCDLWGEAGRKALLIREYFLLMAVVIAVVLPFMLLSMCFQADRKWYQSQPKVEKDEFVTSLEARSLLTTDDSQAELDKVVFTEGLRLKAVSEVEVNVEELLIVISTWERTDTYGYKEIHVGRVSYSYRSIQMIPAQLSP